MTTAAPLAAAHLFGSVYEAVVLRGRRAGRGTRRAQFPGAAVAPPSRGTSGSSQAASERPVPPLPGETNRCPTWLRAAAPPELSPAYAAGRAAVRSAGGSPTPSNKRGGTGRRTGRALASERASVRSPSPEPAPLPAQPSRVLPALFVVRAHLSGPPGRTPSGRAHAESPQVRGAGLGGGGGGGQAADGETRAAWRRGGDPFPGHCRRGCSFDF